MKSILTTVALTLGAILASGAALAGESPIAVPEPISLSLLAGGIVAIAAVKGLRRK
jgi:hypothetical protein